MAVIRLSSLSKLNPLWLCFIVELLFSFVYIPMAINAQLIHQQQSTLTNDKAAMMTNDDHNQHSFASLMIANDFCKFIFNVINDDDDEGDDVVSNDNQQFTNGHIEPLNRSKKMIRSIFEMNEEDTPSIITTPHVNHRHHHNHHLHYSHTHPSAVTTTPLPSSNLNSNDSLKESSSSTSLPLTVFPKRNNTKESSISSTTSSTFEDDKIRNPVSTQKSSYSRLSLNSNDENSIKQAEKKWPFPAVRQKRERNLKDTSGYKKNPYHYSYSPPSNSHPVYIGLEILDIDRINDAENYFSIQLYLFEMWEEPRLNTTALRYWSRKSGPIPVLEANMASCIWTPSLIFEDSTEKEHLLPPTSILLANPEMNRSLVLLRKSRYSLKVRCHMNLQIYPMDKHSCHFKIRTFTDPVRKVSLKWLSDSGSPKPDLLDENRNEIIYSNEFAPSLFDIRVQRPAGKYRITWLNDHYSMLDVEFIFERRIIHSLLTVYIPSSLIVVLSWLQFWFDVEAVPGRMSLGIMSTLTIMTQILTNYEKAGNHVTAVDIWLFVCLIMVFLALMEYALAYTISHYYDNFDDDLDDVCDGVDVDHNNNSNNKKLVEFDSKEPMLMANTDIDALIFDRLKSNPTSTNCVPISATVNQQATGIHHSNNNNNNQVTPMKTSSLPADILLNENRITSPTTSDRIIQAQQQIHKASQELETILTERYAETLNMIRSTQRSVRDAQRLQLTLSLIEQQQHQQQPKMNENDNSKYQLHQRKSAFNNSSSNKQQSAKPIPTTGRKSRRLSRFRQSLRRQISSRNQRMNRNRLNAGGYDGQRSKLSEVDYCSRYLFPFSFVLFAIGYWIALIYYKLIS